METHPDERLSSVAAPRTPTSLISSRSFQTNGISRDIDTVAKFIGAGDLGLFGSLIVGYANDGNQQLSYTMLGFALSEAMGLFCLMAAFPSLFVM